MIKKPKMPPGPVTREFIYELFEALAISSSGAYPPRDNGEAMDFYRAEVEDRILSNWIKNDDTDKKLKLTPEQAAARIKQIHKDIETLKCQILDIATANCHDFHWMRGKVSDIWTCNDSPIGYCIFPKDDNGYVIDECQYCGKPQERK